MGARYSLITLILLFSLTAAIDINAIQPEDSAFFNTTNINFTLNVTPNASQVTISLNGSCNAMNTNDNITWYYESSGELSEGTSTIEFNASKDNETDLDSIVVNIDSTSPNPSISSPSNQTYNSSAQLNFSHDEINPETCWYDLNGEIVFIGYENGTSITEERSHHLQLWCNDSAGNKGMDEVWFTISIPEENKAPVISILEPENQDYENVDEFEFKATDDNASEMQCFYRIDSDSWEEIGDVDNNTKKEVNIDNINDGGSHSIEVKCSDGKLWGNKKRSFDIDDEPPEIEIIINDGDSTTKSRKVTIEIETNSDAEQCRFKNGSSSWGDWDDPLDEEIDYTLPAGDGKKTVYYQCEDDFGNRAQDSDSIKLVLCGNNRLDEGEICDGNIVRKGYICSSDCNSERKKETSSSSNDESNDETIVKELSVETLNNSKILEDYFNHSLLVLNFTEKSLEDFEIKTEIKAKKLVLTGKYNGKTNIKDFVLIFEVPKSFAENADDLDVETNALIEVIEEDPVYAFHFTNIKQADEFLVSFETNSECSLVEVKNDLETPHILAYDGSEPESANKSANKTVIKQPKELPEPIKKETIEATTKPTTQTETTPLTGLLLIGGTISVLGIVIVLLVAGVALFLKYKKEEKIPFKQEKRIRL